MRHDVTWESICDKDWNDALPQRWRGRRLRIVRVRPGTERYESVGYLYLPEVTANPNVPRFIRSLYADVLSMDLHS